MDVSPEMVIVLPERSMVGASMLTLAPPATEMAMAATSAATAATIAAFAPAVMEASISA